MGILDNLCDTDEHISWSSFWKIESTCSLAILGAVIPFIYASSTTLALFVTTVRGDSSSTSGTKGRRKQHRFRSINSHSTNARSNGGIARGIEESKGYYVDEEFLDSAQEPLIRQESNGGSNMLGEAGSEERRTPKKETGVHWLKLLLYWVQVFYHLCVGCFFLVDGHGNHPYKYASNAIFILAWLLQCGTECLQYNMMWRQRNPVYQAVFPCLALASALWLADREDAFEVKQWAVWNAGVLVLIFVLEVVSCIRIVRIKYYTVLTPEYSASIWSLYNYDWFTRIIDKAYRNQLTIEQCPDLVDGDRAENVWQRFSKLLYPRGSRVVRDGEELHVGKNIVRLGGSRYYLQAMVALTGAFSQLIPPIALNVITDFMDRWNSRGEGVPLRVIIAVAGLSASMITSNYGDTTMFKLGRRMGIRARSALISAVFRKAMSLDMSSASAGQLQNHISVDAEAVLNLMVFQMFMWGALIRLISCIIMLFWVLGISAVSGLSLVFLSLPINKILVAKLKNYQLKLMKRRDERMSVVNETMNGIRIIKLFAWEPNFVTKVMDARNLEMVLLRSYMFTLGCFMVVVKSSPTIIGVITFLVHTKLLDQKLSAATGFTALALFQQLRMPLIVLPDTINYYIQARVSFNRIGSFLSRTADDVKQGGMPRDHESDRHCPELARGELRIENASFRWRQSALYSQPTLSDINLEIKPGQLVCVYGATGAGKSSLLMACLQELVTLSGRSLMNGSVAFASQRAWIQNATVRDNILFGCPFNARRYNMVLDVCALKSDLEILEGGDMTEIGEKGVNLSGGQQQRVSLARAVYADTDILLLDDVLSAVDAHVGKHIFDMCIRRALRKKTVVLVTHQVTMSAPYADKIVIMDGNGTIKEQGTYEDLSSQAEGKLMEVIEASGVEGAKLVRQTSVLSSFADDKDVKDADKPEPVAKIIEVERQAVGRPKLSLFTTYCRYCGGLWFGAMLVAATVGWQALTVAQGFALKAWINDMANGEHEDRGLWSYVLVSFASFSLLLFRTLLVTFGSLNASRTVHASMIERVLGTPISWFDATPLGRIFNRFSNDIITLDKDLMNDVLAYFDMLLGVVGVVGVIASVIPTLTLAMIPILALCYYFSNRYLQTSRQLKRLEAVTRSPLYAHFSESVSGVATIRAYEAENRFIGGNEDRTNRLNRAHFSLWTSNYWLTNRVRLVGAVVCGVVGGFLIASVSSIDGSTAGLVLTYSLNFTLAVVFTVRLHAQMEMSINSIERLDEYCKLPQEAPAIIPDRRPPTGWPSLGEVEINNLTLKYATSSEPVLHGLTFHVPPRTRVGIVGRTGAGKSSLMNALFRMVEPQPGSAVLVDGQDILKMGLQDLRRRLAIIPQDPTLFEGTVRSNIDRYDDHTDADVWEALRQCRLSDFVSSQHLLLQHAVATGGSNLSVGQRQLMCMARALLRRAAVLVMDEATANVDPETDSLIQEAMKDGFGDCTVLCIAHRLHTVAFYDRVLVLDQGRVVEYDTPLALLDKPNGQFRGMCEKTGDFAGLRRIAEESAAPRTMMPSAAKHA